MRRYLHTPLMVFYFFAAMRVHGPMAGVGDLPCLHKALLVCALHYYLGPLCGFGNSGPVLIQGCENDPLLKADRFISCYPWCGPQCASHN